MRVPTRQSKILGLLYAPRHHLEHTGRWPPFPPELSCFFVVFFVHFHIFQPLHVEIRRCPLHKSSRQLALATKVAIPTRKKKTTG